MKSTLVTRIDYERDTKKFTKNIHDLQALKDDHDLTKQSLNEVFL